jgi:hypothetical protein
MKTLVAMLLAGCASAVAAQTFVNASDRLPAKTGRGHSMNVVVTDMNGDRRPDLVVAMEFGRNRLLLNDGKGGFIDGSAALPAAERDSEEVVVADLDADGDPDIAVANEDDLLPELYLNDGRGRFADASERLRHRVKANAVAVVDVNRDGRPDLFFGGDKVSSLWINRGGGRFADESAARLPATYGGTQDVAVGDIDGDGDPDLVLANEDRNQIYVNDGKGNFTVRPVPPPATGPEESRDAELLDLDGDKDLDLFLANVQLWNPRARPASRVLLNDGKGGFTDATAAWWPAADGNILSATPVDLDRDGRPDLVTTSVGDIRSADPSGAVRTWRNTGTAFVETTATTLPGAPRANGFDSAAADFDGDGKLDLFIAGRGGPDLLLKGR